MPKHSLSINPIDLSTGTFGLDRVRGEEENHEKQEYTIKSTLHYWQYVFPCEIHDPL